MSQLSICNLPYDVLRYVFCHEGPKDVKQLIILSLVNKQFNLCFGDISLWRQFADKHSITNCTTGQQVKQALIDIARREFNPGQSWSLSTLHQVHTTFMYRSCSLSGMDSSERFIGPSGSKLPITFNNKTHCLELVQNSDDPYFLDSFLRIKDKHSNTVITSINLMSIPKRSPLSDIEGLVNPIGTEYESLSRCVDVQLNDDMLVYNFSAYTGNKYLAMYYLDSSHYHPRLNLAYPYLIYGGHDPIKWELSRGGLTYTICKRLEEFDCDNDIEHIYDVDETKYVNFALMPLMKVLNKLKMIDQDQICLLREFVPGTAKVPFHFFCPISCEIMSNPVRDRCGGEGGGCLFDKGTILQSLSEGQALLTPSKIGKEIPAQCPFSTQFMPSIARTCRSIREVVEEETVIVDGEEDVTVPITKFIPCFEVNTNGGLIYDLKLQGEILAWLHTQVFEVQFHKWPEAKKNAFFEQLYLIQKPANPYWGIAEDAFYGRNGQKATMEEKVAALQNLMNKSSSSHFFEDRMESFMEAFSLVPRSYKQEVYGHLCDIQNSANPYEGIGEDAFHGRNGQSSTRAEKMEALRRYIHAAEIDALEWMF